MVYSFSIRTLLPTLPSIGNVLYDLEATTISELQAEAVPWILSSYLNPGVKVSSCVNGYVLLGGYQILGGSGSTGPNAYDGQYYSRTYNYLPSHNQIYLKILVFVIDSWDGTAQGDRFDIALDGNAIEGFRPNLAGYPYPDLCGNPSWIEYPPFTVYLAISHSTSSLNLQVIVHSKED